MSYKTWALTPPFFLLNLAYGNVERHRGMVVESNAYFFPGISKRLVDRFSQASKATTTSLRLSRFESWPNIIANSWFQHEKCFTYLYPSYSIISKTD
jgi:hypothetical protein